MALRQRKGETEAPNSENVAKELTKEETIDLFQTRLRDAMKNKVLAECNENLTPSQLNTKVDESINKMLMPRQGPLPGIKHETKAAKDALENDPYNMQRIFELGVEYIAEEKFSHAANVLIRGWKRTSEIADPQNRFAYLLKLAYASNECEKFKQAEAVIADMEEPEDPDLKFDFCRLATKVYANNNNLVKTLKAFNQGLEKCQTFEHASALWADTLGCLKKVGAYDAARSAIEKKVAQFCSDEDEIESAMKKLQVIEAFGEIKASISSQVTRSAQPLIPPMAKWGLFAFLLCLFVYFLYLMESRSLGLKKLKVDK